MANESHEELMLIGRLAYADPETVRTNLKDYGQRLFSDSLAYPIETMEEALLSRNDPNINFSLAEFAGSERVVKSLYDLSGKDAKDTTHALYLRSLRIACLSNRSCAGIWSRFPASVIGDYEQETLIRSGEGELIYALFTNPIISTDLLSQLFAGNGLFAEIEEDRRCTLIAYASKNPRINDDQSTEHGPDMGLYDVQKAIVAMFSDSPVNKPWFLALERVMSSANPFMLHSPESPEQAKRIVEKWRDFSPEEDDSILQDGFYTGMSYLDEFRIDIASRFGNYRNEGTGFSSVAIGAADSDDLFERCAYYGAGSLTYKEMEKALKRDESAFVYAALQNMSVYDSAKYRLFIEENGIAGYMRDIYTRRCKQFSKVWKAFDPIPVSEWMREDEETTEAEVHHGEEKPSWADTLERDLVALAQRMEESKRTIESLRTYLVWITVIIVAIAASLFW